MSSPDTEHPVVPLPGEGSLEAPAPDALSVEPHHQSHAVEHHDGESEEEKAAAAKETRLAVANAVKLTLSLLGTVLVGIGLRFLIPRYIGPTAFGQVSFGEAFATSFFVFTSFGVDSYIRKEVSTRLGHANDFWSGFLIVRLAAAVLIAGMMAIGLHWMGKGALEWRLSYIFAVGQIAFVHNYTVQSLLHAASEVDELAWMNVGSKFIWGGGILVGLVLGWPLENIAIAFCVSEGIKAFYLSYIARKKLHLRWNVDFKATWALLVASFPYFLNYMCHRTYEKLNVTMLSQMTNDNEVGWYVAATSIAGISLLFLPILQAVVVPMAARTAVKSTEAMNEIMRGAVRLIVVSGTLISLVLVLHADFIADHAFGGKFHESKYSLQMLAPMFPLTYLAVLGALHLIQLNRIWTMIKVSIAALVINPLLNYPLIKIGYGMGPGWAGGMSAVATICTEGANAFITFAILGSAAVDKRFWGVLAKTVVICAAVTGVHSLLPTWGVFRVALEVPLYLILAVVTGALPAADIRRMVTDAVKARRGAKSA